MNAEAPILVSKHDLSLPEGEHFPNPDPKLVNGSFHWENFRVITFERSNGKNIILSGKEQWMAALLSRDVDALPCVLAVRGNPGSSAKNEEKQESGKHEKGRADAKRRGREYAYVKFSKAVLSKEPIALKTKEIADKYGFTICGGGNDGPTHIHAIDVMQQIVREDSDVAELTMMLLSKINGLKFSRGRVTYGVKAANVVGAVIKGVFYLIRHNELTEEMEQKLVAIGMNTLRKLVLSDAAKPRTKENVAKLILNLVNQQ